MSEPEFVEIERRFAAHIRDPERAAPPPDAPPERMAVYVRLFFRNIAQFLDSAFPVLRSLYTPQAWAERVRAFIATHRAQSPYFRDIPLAFLRFLEHEYRPTADDPPFLLELAHYEWVELALDVAEDPVVPAALDPNGDLLAGRPWRSPLAWPLAYRWPVHRIGPDFRPSTPPPEPTFLLVFRDRRDRVRFDALNAASYRLLRALDADPPPRGAALLEALAAELGHPDPRAVIEGGHQTLEALRAQGVILGALP